MPLRPAAGRRSAPRPARAPGLARPGGLVARWCGPAARRGVPVVDLRAPTAARTERWVCRAVRLADRPTAALVASDARARLRCREAGPDDRQDVIGGPPRGDPPRRPGHRPPARARPREIHPPPAG